MTKLTFAAVLALSVLAIDAPAQAASTAAGLSPYAGTGVKRRPNSARTAHCERKADGVGVQGKAREIYMRKCMRG